jgi:hypothetical protein
LKFLLSIALSIGLAFAQSTSSTLVVTGPVAGGGGNPTSYQYAFDVAYYNSKPPSFQPLYNGLAGAQNATQPQLSQSDRVALLNSLFAQGLPVDPFIEGGAGNVDPFTIHYVRQLQGWAWVYPGTGLQTSSQVLGMGNVLPAPPGAIVTDTNVNDYKPYPKPVVVPPSPVAKVPSPIGIRISFNNPINGVGDWWSPTPNDGYNVTDTWTGVLSSGLSGTWTKQALEAGIMIIWTKTN